MQQTGVDLILTRVGLANITRFIAALKSTTEPAWSNQLAGQWQTEVLEHTEQHRDEDTSNSGRKVWFRNFWTLHPRIDDRAYMFKHHNESYGTTRALCSSLFHNFYSQLCSDRWTESIVTKEEHLRSALALYQYRPQTGIMQKKRNIQLKLSPNMFGF